MNNQDDRSRATKIVKAKLGFYIHLLVFVLVNIGLAAINLTTNPDKLWFQWPLLGWGLGIGLHALLAFGGRKVGSLREWMIQREMRKLSTHRAHPQS